MLPAIVQMVIMLVNGNLGTGVAVMGAFSLVRFRSAPGRGQEITSIFLAMAVGLATGMGYIGIAILFTVMITVINLLLNVLNFGTDSRGSRILRITVPEDLDYEGRFEDLFTKYLREYDYDEIKTTNMGSLYKLTLSVILKEGISTKEFIDELRTRNGNLDIKDALPLLISVLTASVAGSYAASLFPDRAVGNLAQIGLILVGLRFLLMKEKEEEKPKMSGSRHLLRSIFGGILVGFTCGFIGAGGGVMLLLILTIALGYDMHLAVGTSVFIMAFTALIGGVSHFVIGGMPDLIEVVACVIFTYLFARMAAKDANKAKPIVLHRIVGLIMVATALIVLLVKGF